MTQAAIQQPQATASGASALRPYPESLSRKNGPCTPQAKAAAAELVGRHLSFQIIPPQQRAVVAGHSIFCPQCERFTRCGGACPGVRSADRALGPVCLIDTQTGRMESPMEDDGPSAAGKEAQA